MSTSRLEEGKVYKNQYSLGSIHTIHFLLCNYTHDHPRVPFHKDNMISKQETRRNNLHFCVCVVFQLSEIIAARLMETAVCMVASMVTHSVLYIYQDSYVNPFDNTEQRAVSLSPRKTKLQSFVHFLESTNKHLLEGSHILI